MADCFNRIADSDICQHPALTECLILDDLDRIRNDNTCEPAVEEGPFLDSRNVIGNIDMGQRGTKGKDRFIDYSQRLRDIDLAQFQTAMVSVTYCISINLD